MALHRGQEVGPEMRGPSPPQNRASSQGQRNDSVGSNVAEPVRPDSDLQDPPEGEDPREETRKERRARLKKARESYTPKDVLQSQSKEALWRAKQGSPKAGKRMSQVNQPAARNARRDF